MSLNHFGIPLYSYCAVVAVCSIFLFWCGGGASTQSGVVIVDSAPESGAVVWVGAAAYAKTPCRITGLPPGETYITLTMEGYERKNRLVSIPESGEIRVLVTLERLKGYLKVETTPPFAKVYVDGEFFAETPFGFRPLVIGEHTYEIRKENYETITRPLLVDQDLRYAKNHVLTPLDAELKVQSQPSNATIWINEERREEKTPARFSLPPGPYTVSVYTKDHIMIERVYELGPNEAVEAFFTLEKGSIPPGMVLVSAGEFDFGDRVTPDEKPRKRVHLDGFYIDKFEVTNQDFVEVFPSHVFSSRKAAFPVSGVTWKEADQYARAVGKRLPTELEWEKAARGTDGRSYPWGFKFEAANANGGPKTLGHSAKVGSYRTGISVYGCMDMVGNVLEWTADWYKPYVGNTDINTEYGMVFRVLRGGSYLYEDPFDLRCSRRLYERPNTRREDFGFRCVIDATE